MDRGYHFKHTPLAAPIPLELLVAKQPTYHAGHRQALLVEHMAAVEDHHAEGLSCVWGRGQEREELSAVVEVSLSSSKLPWGDAD